MGQRTGAYTVLVGRPEGKTPLGILRRIWEDNIKMDLTEVGWTGMDWIYPPEDKNSWRTIVNVVMNLRAQQNAGKFLAT
jgi:hypothetical protein